MKNVADIKEINLKFVNKIVEHFFGQSYLRKTWGNKFENSLVFLLATFQFHARMLSS